MLFCGVFTVEEGRRKRTAYEGPRPSDYDKLCEYKSYNIYVGFAYILRKQNQH